MRTPLVALLSGMFAVGTCVIFAQQQAQDRTAFLAARAQTIPALRVAALLQFAHAYPETGLAQQAQMLALSTDLQAFPERTAEIHTLAANDVASTAPGFERWFEEARIADLLASAGSAGADLADAKTWAQDAVTQTTEESYRRQMLAMQAKYKLDKLTPRQVHGNFVRDRAAILAALANVDLRENDTADAGRALEEAYRLDPLSSEVSSLRGQLALAQGKDAEALAAFERSEAEGDLPPRWRERMAALYKQIDGGAANTLDEHIDALYTQLFPPPFALPARSLPPGGHTVLLELFTGAGCQPCIAPDLAVEGLLDTYKRNDLVVLEYDEHIPVPDPLANPDSVARAESYRVGNTPDAFLDGQELPVVGASRADVENVVVGFAEAIEDGASSPSPVQLALTATRDAKDEVTANVVVTKTAVSAVANAQPTVTLPQGAVVHFALVEDHVRYSGENGVRFHRMVVRSLQTGSSELRSGADAGPVNETATFKPTQISKDQAYYLQNFAEDNDRFGEVHFLTTDIPIRSDHLAVVAWVEDPRTHQVLQAAYTAVP